jgi:Uma2 family endonuclease
MRMMTTYSARLRPWTRREYRRLGDLGIIREDEPVELIGGQLIVAEPKNTPHAAAVALVADALRLAFGPGWLVRQQDPIALDDDSEPEPDVSVVRGSPRDYLTDHPARPVLVVEVAESSLRFDRREKGSLYARAGLPEYWIVNLRGRRLEVYRDPAPADATPFGWRYRDVKAFLADARVSPLGRPDVTVAVADLLP